MSASHYITAASLTSDTLLRLWATLTPEQQADIVVKTLHPVFADIVAGDDGMVTTEAERDAAVGPAQEGCQALFEAVESAFPHILWWYPADRRYEARDASGRVLGMVDDTSTNNADCGARWTYQFTAAGGRPGRKVRGEPRLCLPKKVEREVDAGGWFGVVLPDGRQYPDDLCPLSSPEIPDN